MKASLIDMAHFLVSLGWLDLFNITLALCALLVSFGSINLMRDVASHVDVMSTVIMMRRSGARWWTSMLAGLHSADTMAVACSFITLTAGLAGQIIGQVLGKWQASFDTVLFAGILALLVANRRQPAVHAQRAPISLAITALAWLVFFFNMS
jgi:hypothetical protein